MEWTEDENCLAALDDLMSSMNVPLHDWFQLVYPYTDSHTAWHMLFTFGVFVRFYNEEREKSDEALKAVFHDTMNRWLNHNMTQELMARLMNEAQTRFAERMK